MNVRSKFLERLLAISYCLAGPVVWDMVRRGLRTGAVGSKLTGAGDGGFILLFVKPEKKKKVKNTLSKLIHVPFKSESSGSQIIFRDREADYSAEEISINAAPPRVFRELERVEETEKELAV